MPSVRIDDTAAELAAPLAKLLGWSLNQFTERALSALVTLANTAPAKRSVPELVLMLDAIRAKVSALPATPAEAAVGEETIQERVARLERAVDKYERMREAAQEEPGKGKAARKKRAA